MRCLCVIHRHRAHVRVVAARLRRHRGATWDPPLHSAGHAVRAAERSEVTRDSTKPTGFDHSHAGGLGGDRGSTRARMNERRSLTQLAHSLLLHATWAGPRHSAVTNNQHQPASSQQPASRFNWRCDLLAAAVQLHIYSHDDPHASTAGEAHHARSQHGQRSRSRSLFFFPLLRRRQPITPEHPAAS